jgi:isopentenyl diphosphate isomerase/L-lactate dehydrogenase-like FMN-dependent dehydrogenase
MGRIENEWRFSMGRRRALASLATMLAGSPLLHAQLDPHGVLTGHKRVPGIDEMMTAFDFEPICFANMTLERFDYMQHGDGSEFNLRRDRQAFDWVDILPGRSPSGQGIDPKTVDLSSTLLGVDLKYPVYVAPSSGQGALHPDGEMGMYRGATAAGTIMAIASGPSIPHPRIAASSTGPRWNQFYPIPDVDASADALAGYQDLGTKAVIITVDQQASVYERDLHDRNLGGSVRGAGGRGAAIDPETGQPVRGGGAGRGGRGGPPVASISGNPIAPTFPANSKYRVSNRRLWYNWGYVNAVRKSLKVPVIIKGVLTAEDAAECVKQGVDAIIVSNHGGRSMDYGPSTLEVLPEIVAAVNGRLPVIVDSGFRRGSDVFKALALGASAVELGRAARWGLGAFGAAGTQRLLEIVQGELVQAAAFAGRRTLKDIDKTAVKTNFA